MHIAIIDNQILFRSYDKRRDFNFPVTKFPMRDSCISETAIISTFAGEFLRLYRLNDLLIFYLQDLTSLIHVCTLNGIYKDKLVRQAVRILTKRHSF